MLESFGCFYMRSRAGEAEAFIKVQLDMSDKDENG